MTTKQDEIVRIEGLRAAAIVQSDLDTLSSLTSADFVHVDASAQRRTKQEFLSALGRESRTYTRYETTTDNVTYYSDVAIVTGEFDNEHLAVDGRTVITSGRFTRIYIHRDGQWCNVLHHGTAKHPVAGV